jgi:lysophospholipase L1-like esterase
MTILTVGDSFTFGAELSDVPEYLDATGQQYWDESTSCFIKATPSQLAWPALLAKKLNQPVDNHGVVGVSNDRIFRHTIATTAKNQYSLVICAWTALERLDISYQGKEVCVGAMNPGWDWVKSYYADHYDHAKETEKWLVQILGMQSYFQQRNQKYILVNTMPMHKFPIYNYLINQIDFDCFFNWNSCLQDLCKDVPRGRGGHFLEQGHEIVADHIYNFIKTKSEISL